MKSNSLYVMYGNNDKEMILETLKTINLASDIPDKNSLIGIKPNLVLAKPSESGATTSPNLVEGVIEYLISNDLKNIVILEGSWVGARTPQAFDICGYTDISRKYKLPLVDLQKDSSIDLKVGNMAISVCKEVTKLDYLINMPVLKGHCQTSITCALKNLKGCIPNKEKRRFHTMGLHKPIGYLNAIIKQNLIIVDGIIGDLNFEEGGNPVQMNRIIVGKDPVKVDSYVAQLLGYDVEDIPYIEIAESLNVGRRLLTDEEIIELNQDSNPMTIPKSRLVQRLGSYVDDDMACSACYGSLIHALDRLDDIGYLSRIKSKINIGQGFKDKEVKGLGIGMCTKGCDSYLTGCPPKAKDIIDFLKKEL